MRRINFERNSEKLELLSEANLISKHVSKSINHKYLLRRAKVNSFSSGVEYVYKKCYFTHDTKYMKISTRKTYYNDYSVDLNK